MSTTREPRPLVRSGNSKAMRARRDDAKFQAWSGTSAPAADEVPAFYARPRFLSDSGRTISMLDRAGMQRLAEEHEWMRDRIAHLELANALLRSVIETGPRPAVGCADPATA